MNADSYASTAQGLLGNNMFAYCLNNPVNCLDKTGEFAVTILSVVAFVDSVLIASDTLLAIGAIAFTIGVIEKGRESAYKKFEKEEEKTETQVLSQTKRTQTPIYRYGGTSPSNLKPSNNDVLTNTGLSFSTVPMPGAAMTTIEAINSTGILYAVKDGKTHVSVYPIGTNMAGWRAAGNNSIWTRTLKTIVVKWN